MAYCFPIHPRSLIVPLLYREIVLRALLVSAPTNLFANICYMSYFPIKFIHAPDCFYYIIVPLLIVLHHLFRIWPRKRWLVAFEALSSLAETAISAYLLSLNTARLYPESTPLARAFGEISGFLMSLSSIFSFVFLLCDIFHSHGKSLPHPYDFSAGLCQSNRRWSFILGRSTTRKRFSTDTLFVQSMRGGLAILCLLVLSYLVIYTIIWQPVRWSLQPGIKIYEAPTYEIDSFFPAQTVQQESQIKVALGGLSTNMVQKINLNITTLPPNHPTTSCQYDFSSIGSALVSCVPSIFPLTDSSPTNELLITVQFLGGAYEFPVYLGLGNSTDDILTNAEPTFLGPGSNLHGVTSVLIKKRFTDQGAAPLGVPQYRQIGIINVHALSPDWLPSLPRGNTTATLRVTILPQSSVRIEQEYLESSILNGFALVGGAWTLINGIFAAVFGTTLLLVLFGIKPLSIYGLVHRFQRGKASLIDRDHVLSPKERDYTVGILREHLMDVDDEADWELPSDYDPVNVAIA